MDKPDGTREAIEEVETKEGKNSFYSHKFLLHSWGMGGIAIG